MMYTPVVASSAPTKANQMYPLIEVTPKKPMPIVTANEAPALTPRIPGSASGLRVNAWISPPARPSPMPTRIPSSVLGSRSSRTTS